MLIVYGKDIGYDPERSDHSERQKLVSNIARSLANNGGEIELIKPEQVSIQYNIQSGEVIVKSKIGSVNNTFSDLEKQITEPIEEAISLKAKIALLEKLASLSDDAISKRIRANHGSNQSHSGAPFKCEMNLTTDAVDNTLRQIQRLGITGVRLFFGGETKTPIQLRVTHALREVMVENIKSMNHVDLVVDKISSRAPALKAQPTR